MQYTAIVAREGKQFTIEFPDAVGCQTFAEREEDIPSTAREALEGWLEANLAERMIPPRPRRHASAPRGTKLVAITVGARLASALQVRWARQDRNLSQGELAKLVGVTQQQIAKLEDPDANPSLSTLEKVAAALGGELRLDLSLPTTRTQRAS